MGLAQVGQKPSAIWVKSTSPLTPNTRMEPTAPAGALKIARFLKIAFPTYQCSPPGAAAHVQAVSPPPMIVGTNRRLKQLLYY